MEALETINLAMGEAMVELSINNKDLQNSSIGIQLVVDGDWEQATMPLSTEAWPIIQIVPGESADCGTDTFVYEWDGTDCKRTSASGDEPGQPQSSCCYYAVFTTATNENLATWAMACQNSVAGALTYTDGKCKRQVTYDHPNTSESTSS